VSEKLAMRVSLAGIIVSGLLAVTKLVIGWVGGSTSVVADGLESAADVVTSSIVLFGLTVASRPPDENHPYGHGRFEILTGLGVGNVLAMTGALISWGSLSRIGIAAPPPAPYTIWPLLLSIVGKSFLAVYKFRFGRRIRSAALVADAQNDSVDILSGTVALCALGLTLFSPQRFAASDKIGGSVVGLIVVFLGLRVAYETTMELMDTMPDETTMGQIRRAALEVPGALGIEKCYARKTGFKHHVDLHLEVDPKLNVIDSHDIAQQVRERIKAQVDWVADVMVHVEPHAGLGGYQSRR
jgi:cation diffusion facilitator family transporter